MLEVIHPGIFSSIQDLGRVGYRQDGVSQAGALDPLSLRLANRLVGNSAGAAAIEVMLGQLQIKFNRSGWIALTGADCLARLDDVPVYCGWRMPVRKGQILQLKVARSGLCTYLAVRGGIDVPTLMGSRSTDIQAGLGGLDGRALKAGDRLAVRQAEKCHLEKLGILLPTPLPQLRVLPGADWSSFTAQAREHFMADGWQVTPTSNRMGFRLQGPVLQLQSPLELPSSGVFPGVIQVPPSGQPIILAAEGQSTGGYPRIGAVIRSDLWKLGQLRPGQTIYFTQVTADEAAAAWQVQQRYLQRVEMLLASQQDSVCDALI